MRITAIGLVPWRGFLQPPVHTARAVLTRRQGWTLSLTDEAEHTGVGEAAPLPRSDRGTALALRQLALSVVPEQPSEIAQFVAGLALPPAAGHAVEQALLELLAQRTGRSVAVLLGGREDAALPLHALVDDAAGARAAVAAGATAVKVKVGRLPLEADVARVAAVRSAVGPDVRLRLDANGAWTLAEAQAALTAFAPHGIEWLEEPVRDRDLAALAALRSWTRAPSQHGLGIALAVDESCRDGNDLAAVLAARAADIVVLKPMLVGSLHGTVALAHAAAAAGLRVVVTTCLDGPVAEAAVVAVARACPPHALIGVGLDRRLAPGHSRRSPLPVAGLTIPQPLSAAAVARPHHAALHADVHETLNFRQLADLSGQLATWLARQGVGPGPHRDRRDTVALLAPAAAPFVVALHGIGWLGAVAAPLDVRATLADRAVALRLLQPDIVLVAPGLAVPAGPWRVRELPTVAALSGLPVHPAQDWALTEVRVHVLTSGSTGSPKLVALTTAQWLFGTFGSAIRLGHDPGERWLACLPLHHVGCLAILMRSLWLATTVVLHERFDAARVAQALDAGDATAVSLVPTQLARVLATRASVAFPKELRVVLLGGAPAEPGLLARCRALHVPVARTWGMTETASQVATAAPDDPAPGLPPLPFAAVSTLPNGRLQVTGPLAGASPLLTGDHGVIDADGRVHVHGRVDNVIVRGGENLAPEPIETTLLRHAAVAEAIVVGMPHPIWGQVPAAVVVVRAPVSVAELHDFMAAQVPPPSRPVRYLLVPELPRSATGKLLRGRVRQWLQQAQAGQAAAQTVRDLARQESLQVDEGVDVAHLGVQHIILQATDLEHERDGPLAHAGDADCHCQPVAETHGRAKVGLGVDQGHAPTLAVEHVGHTGSG